MKGHTPIRSMIVAVLSVAVAASAGMALENSYTEDFTSKQYCDTVNTTAWWDTDAGELKLYPFELAHIGSTGTSAFATGVAVAGDMAYIADGSSGLRVIDISDPANPVFSGAMATYNSANAVEVAGNYAYVADGTAGLTVCNIAYPGPGPSQVFDTPGYAQDVAIAGDYAYVADGDSGLYVLDITNELPTYAGNIPTLDYASGVDVQGNYAYVADDDSGLVVIDISHPPDPVIVGRYDTPYWAMYVEVSGDYAFVADYGSGLQIIDVSDPTDPEFAGSCDTDGNAYKLNVSGDYVYVADLHGGLAVIDVSTPSNPTLVHSHVLSDSPADVAVAGECAFVAAYYGTFHVLEICERLDSPAYLTSIATPGNAYGIAVQGDYAYVADWYSGLHIFDISDPTNPSFAGTYDTASRAKAVEVSGNYAYVADSDSGVVVVDVSDATNPTWTASFPTGGTASELVVDGDYLFVAVELLYLMILDITDPTSPVIAGAYDPDPGASSCIAVDGNYALLGDIGQNEIAIIDVSDVSAPYKIGSFGPMAIPTALVVEGDYAFVSEYGDYIIAIDISDPTSPVALDTLNTYSYVRDIVIDGDNAFLAGYQSGIQVVDVSDPSSLALVGAGSSPEVRAISVAGDYAFTADEDLGFAVSKVYDRYFDVARNAGRSITVMSSTEPIVKARVTTAQSDWVGWWIGQNLGYQMDWINLIPGVWTELANAGTSFVWHSIHIPVASGVNPYCGALTLDWLYECAAIDSVADIPDDQGGEVRVHFTRSAHDFVEDSLLIDVYNVWRRVDDPALLQTLKSDLRQDKFTLHTGLGPTLLEARGRRYLMKEVGQTEIGLPPGTWEVLGSFAAAQQDDYIYPAATLGDSTASGVRYTVYCISAHTIYPWIWYVSPPDSGYSIDNIAPAPPPGLRMESATEVAWDMVPDNDFQYYSVYGTDTPELDPGDEPIGCTVDTRMDVTGDVYDYYHVTATDYAGNEGDPATVDNTYTGSPAGDRQPGKEGLPEVFALGRNRPNPFSETTEIRFDLPVPCHVSIRIFDVDGKLVTCLVDGPAPAGCHVASWSGSDGAGVKVSPGIYFIRMKAGDFIATGKMLLTR